MLINSRKIMTWLEKQFPIELAEDWDNVGFLIGNPDKVIKRVLIALEVTPDVVQEAINKSVDLIVTHHPIIFKPMTQLVENNPHQKMIRQLIFHDMHVYAAHTNADVAEGGLSDMFLAHMKLKAIEGLMPVQKTTDETIDHTVTLLENPGPTVSLGRIAELVTPMELKALADSIKKDLKIAHLRIVGQPKTIVRRIGVLTGAGIEAMKIAKSKRCDVFITGDIKYHEAQDALAMGLSLIDVGHYNSEIIFKAALKKRMVEDFESMDYDVSVEISTSEKDPFQWV